MHNTVDLSALTLQTIAVKAHNQRLQWISDRLHDIHGSGIIYVQTKQEAESVSQWLGHSSHNVEVCYSGIDIAEHSKLTALLTNKTIKALVITADYTIDLDKSNTSFVFHYSMPRSLMEYYQQISRAGLSQQGAYSVILFGDEEVDAMRAGVDTAFPDPEHVTRVVKAIKKGRTGLTMTQIQGIVNLRYNVVQHVLTTISREGTSPFVFTNDVWLSTGQELDKDYWDRVMEHKAHRQSEITAMLDYANLPFGSHRDVLSRAMGIEFHDNIQAQLPALSSSLPTPDGAASIDARHEVRQITMFAPRTEWPTDNGFALYQTTGIIPRRYRAQTGSALDLFGPTRWSGHVRDCRQRAASYNTELAVVSASAIRYWGPVPKATWVTCVPSLRHPRLVADLAKAIADELGIPFYEVLQRRGTSPELRLTTSESERERIRAVNGVFDVNGTPIPSGNVLLIDDIVYSGWTLTVAAWLLRKHGAGLVHPFVIARKPLSRN